MSAVCGKPVLQSGRARLKRHNERPQSVLAPGDSHVFLSPTQFTAGPDESIMRHTLCLLVCLFAGLSMNWDFCLLPLKGSFEKHVGIWFGERNTTVGERLRQLRGQAASGLTVTWIWALGCFQDKTLKLELKVTQVVSLLYEEKAEVIGDLNLLLTVK